MVDPFPIFHYKIDQEMTARIKEMEISIRVKVIAINHHLRKKLDLDR
jgi:hypothetical protein